jgi:hypothetical protein
MQASLIATLTVLAAATACTGTPSQQARSVTPSIVGFPPLEVTKPVTDYSSFTDGLEVAGYHVRQGERLGGDHLFRPGQSVFIDGVRVSTYEYPSEKALDEFKASVSDDAYSIPVHGGGIAIVEWVAPPHFYAAGRLLVLYFGHKQRTLDALDLLMGRSFAGGTVR